jgi:hypothetical protein
MWILGDVADLLPEGVEELSADVVGRPATFVADEFGDPSFRRCSVAPLPHVE